MMVKVSNDIRLNTDSGYVSVLVLLDLSAAFDTVDQCFSMNGSGLQGLQKAEDDPFI